MSARCFFAFWIALTFAPSLRAAVPLFDFENSADISVWKWQPKAVTKLERANSFATSGQAALIFSTQAWKQGMGEWPSFEAKPPVADWTKYDRLVVDITNPKEEPFFFSMFISDSKTPVRNGLSYKFILPSRGYRRFAIPLSTFPKEINRDDISKLHFFTERPKTDMTLYLDNIALLRKDETTPEPGSQFAKQLSVLTAQALDATEPAIAKSRVTAQEISKAAPTQESIRGLFAPLEARIKSLRAQLAAPALTLADLGKMNAEITALPNKTERAVSIIRFQKACADAGQPAANLLIGATTSMEKILPRDAPFDIKPAKDVVISLARNEKESFQIAVLPAAGALRKVAVKAADLKSDGGALLKRENIQCEVVGYVETKTRPPYGTPHIGWWPDPILNFLGAIDIAAGDLQSFWIRVRAPKDQPPGLYRGSITVSSENGGAPANLNLSVRVRPFTLPDRSPLPLAVTFMPEDSPARDLPKDQLDAIRASSQYPVNAWKQQKMRWADLLADYYISYDSLYRRAAPDFEVLSHLHEQGRLGMFNLGYFYYMSSKPNALEDWTSKTLPWLREGYAKAKELKLLDHAYIYGCDEVKKEFFPQVQKVTEILKAAFPGVMLMTTTYDQTYGMDSPIKTMDAFCPLTPSFDPVKAGKARAAGKQVWWYICCGPHHPHANMFIEYPAIEGRLLMGAMTARQRPDGFLYYEISIWNSRKPIESGPFTDWDPRSWTTYHGDGSWVCVGPGGGPVPTIRLENFRDGLEDYAYAVILGAIVKKIESKGATQSAQETQWLADARAALAIPETLVKSMTDYSREPAALYAWRDRMGDLIERSGMPDTNPWKDN